ncbi:MAG TPA: tripartite tricarboxylate transporter substrate binding protein [Bordetella sp.]|nr:tripartite tricarboxylate transporter substrate binding protein [Bordetella sp.]
MRKTAFRSGIAIAAALLGAVGLAPLGAHAQAWPGQAITIVVPFPAGGTSDNLARGLGQKLGERFGQPVIIENKPGAGTMIGTEQVARAKPDGYTVGVVANSFTINPSLHDNMRYDSRKDFVPVSYLAYTPHMLVAHPDAPAKTLGDLVAYAKQHPGALSFASFGTGTSPHLAIEMLKAQAGIDVVHVPYKGQAPALNDLLGGHVPYMFANVPDVLPHVKSGKLVAVALANDQRIDSAKDVATFKELGFGDFASNSWFGLVAPAGTPDPVAGKMADALRDALGQADIKARLTEQGFVAVGTTPAQFKEYLDSEFKKAESLVKASGATAN